MLGHKATMVAIQRQVLSSRNASPISSLCLANRGEGRGRNKRSHCPCTQLHKFHLPVQPPTGAALYPVASQPDPTRCGKNPLPQGLTPAAGGPLPAALEGHWHCVCDQLCTKTERACFDAPHCRDFTVGGLPGVEEKRFAHRGGLWRPFLRPPPLEAWLTGDGRREIDHPKGPQAAGCGRGGGGGDCGVVHL